MMLSLKIFVSLLAVVLTQCTVIDAWWWKKTEKTDCSDDHPHSTTGNAGMDSLGTEGYAYT